MMKLHPRSVPVRVAQTCSVRGAVNHESRQRKNRCGYPSRALAVLGAAVMLTAGGCGEQPGGETTGGPSGASAAADRLIGNWEGTAQLEGADSDPNIEALGAAFGNYGMSAEFKSDGTFVRAFAVNEIPDPSPWSGKWRVVESAGDRLTIEITATVDGQPETRRAGLEFEGDNRMAYLESGDEWPKFILSRVSDP